MSGVDFVLKAKGESKYISVQDLTVTLRWRSAVDLDLVAFYRRKDGGEGGVFSTHYLGGDLGALTRFPFMQLSGDALESDGREASEEVLRVARLDEIAQLYILALNQTAAREGSERGGEGGARFSDYDLSVEVKTSRGQVFEVPLGQSAEGGVVALVCRIDNTNAITGPQLINEGRVMRLSAFYEEVPGARALRVGQKLVLRAKGDSAPLARPRGDMPVHARLTWSASVDLDLNCFYVKGGELRGGGGGFFDRLFGSLGGQVHRIYFGQRGSLTSEPFICLDQDAGIGDKGGENEENIEISKTVELDALLFCANIFNKPDASFGDYDGAVTVRCGDQEVEVPLKARERGAWALIALVDCRGDTLRVVSVDEVQRTPPTFAHIRALANSHRRS